MTRKEFGCFFMTGEQKKSPFSVEELKRMSAYAEYEMELKKQKEKLEEERNQLRVHREVLENMKREIEEEKEENEKRIREEAEAMYREAVRRDEQEALEKMRAAKEAEDADQPQEEKTRGREVPPNFEEIFRQSLSSPEFAVKKAWEALERRQVSSDSMKEDAVQEAQAEYRIPFEFVGFVPAGVHPYDEDEDELEC